jgi:hypothetical protein
MDDTSEDRRVREGGVDRRWVGLKGQSALKKV